MISSWMLVSDDPVVLPAATNDYLFGTTTLPDGWTLTRTAAALGRGSNGRWVSHAINVPRPYHDPVTLANRGILLEPSRTQLIYGSRPVVVTALAATLTTDAVTQTPLGVGGRLLIEDTTNTSHGFNLFFGNATRAAALADDSTVSLQLVFKPVGGLTRAVIFAQLKTAVYQTCVFTFAPGSDPSIVSHDMVAAKISTDTDGHYRLEFTVNYSTGTTSGAAHLSFQRADGTRFYTGDGARGMLLAYYGAELGTECTSPIITTGTSITRPEDVLTSAAGWLRSGAKSIGIEYTPMGADTDTVFHAVGADSIEVANATNSVSAIISSAGSFATLQGVAAAAGVERTTVLSTGFDAAWLAEEGTKLAFSEVVPPPTALDSVRVGARTSGAFPGPMTLKRIKYWGRSLDREVAAAYSADISIPGVEIVLPVIDVQPTITVPADQSILSLTVTLEGEPTGASVSYRTINGTAIAGGDYLSAVGVLEFRPGESFKEIDILLGVRSLEQTRSFSVELTTPSGAVLGNALCVVTLTKAAPSARPPLKSASFTGALSADWSFTRSTPGYTRGSNGVWVSVATNTPRIIHSAADDVGILLEPATTQCLFDSAHFGYTSNSTRTPLTNGTTPTGSRYMTWRETAVLGNHLMRSAWNTTQATWPTGDFTLWGFFKPVGPRTRYKFTTKGIDGVYKSAFFELSGAGSVASTTAADVIPLIETVPFFPGWYRIGVARTQAVTAGVSAEWDIGPVDPATNSNQLQGDTTYGLDICHFQCEPGLFWTSPILANAATAATTRGIDILKATGGWQARNNFAMGVKFRRLNDTPASQRIVQFRDTAPSVDDFGLLTVSGALRTPLTTDATFHGNIDGPATALNTYTTAIVSIDTDRYALFSAGAKVGEISMIGKPMPELVEHLRFGSKEQDGSQAAPIIIQTAAYWTAGMSDDEGIVFSADLTGTPPGGEEPGALPVVSIPAFLSVAEGAAIVVPITKTGSGACSVNFRTAAQTASFGVDYTGIGNPDPAHPSAHIVTFAANETSKTVNVQTAADTDATEANEKFAIHIGFVNTNPPDCSLGNAAGEVTILETPTVAIQAAVNVNEGAAASISVVKSGVGACSVTYRTVAQTATLGSDYTGISSTTLSFGANETTKTITVQTLADAVTENTNETFRVVIENPVGCKLGTTTGCTVTIVDPASEPPPTGGIYDAPVGFATTVDAGIGQTPYYVTSLANTSTTGTLRHALTQSNRCIVFEVGGRMVMSQEGMRVTGSNLTVCGETAPAPGIIIQGGDFIIGAVQNVHFRHITFERGHDDRVVCNSNGDAIHFTSTNSTTWCENIWFDHCAMLWSNDEVVSFWPSANGLIRNVSLTNCIFAEPLWHPENVEKPSGGYYRGHHEGTLASGACRTEYGHNYGIIIGYRTGNVDIQHSAFVDCGNRAPFIDANTRVVVANVLALNCSQGAWVCMNTYENPVKAFKVTVAGYLAISGNNSSAYQIVRIHSNAVRIPPAGSALWAKGLYNWKGVGAPNTPSTTIGTIHPEQQSAILNSDTQARPIDIPNNPVPILTADQIYQRTKDNVGPRPKDRANGPASVRKVVAKIEAKASKYVNMPSEVGGLSTLSTKTRSLRAQGDANPPKFADGTVIPAFPSPSTDKAKVRAWLRRFLDEVQYD